MRYCEPLELPRREAEHGGGTADAMPVRNDRMGSTAPQVARCPLALRREGDGDLVLISVCSGIALMLAAWAVVEVMRVVKV